MVCAASPEARRARPLSTPRGASHYYHHGQEATLPLLLWRRGLGRGGRYASLQPDTLLPRPTNPSPWPSPRSRGEGSTKPSLVVVSRCAARPESRKAAGRHTFVAGLSEDGTERRLLVGLGHTRYKERRMMSVAAGFYGALSRLQVGAPAFTEALPFVKVKGASRQLCHKSLVSRLTKPTFGGEMTPWDQRHRTKQLAETARIESQL